ATLAHMFEVAIPEKVTSQIEMPPAFAAGAPKFERDVLSVIYAGHGDDLPVSAFPVDGTFPAGTAKWEKRNIALEIPAWDTKLCIQCGKCAMVCPHAVIRIKVYDSKELAGAPATFKSTDVRDKDKDWAGQSPKTGNSSSRFQNSIGGRLRTAPSASNRCRSPCSNFREPVPDAARHPM